MPLHDETFNRIPYALNMSILGDIILNFNHSIYDYESNVMPILHTKMLQTLNSLTLS